MKPLQTLLFKFKNSFYFRMLYLYSIILFFALGLFFTFFTYKEKNNIIDKKINSYNNTISQFQIFSDEYFLDDVYKIMSKDIFKEKSISIDSISDDNFYIYNKNNFDKALELQKFLANLHYYNDFIESIDIYNKKYDTYISSTSGVFYNINTPQFGYKNFINYDLIDLTLSKSNNQFWYIPDKSSDSYQHTASFVQLMPVFLEPSECNIMFIINLNLERVYNNFLSQISSQDNSFKILDHSNQFIFDTSKDHLIDFREDEQLLKTIQANDTGEYIITLNNEKFIVVWTSSTLNDWKYIYTINYKDLSSSLTHSVLFLTICFLSFFIICLGIVFIISKWLYKPLKHLVFLSKNKLTGVHLDNDLVTISSAFSKLDLEVNNLEKIIQKNDILILNNTVHHLINGKIDSLDHLNDRLKLLNRKFIHNSFYLLLIKIDKEDFSCLSYQEKELIPLTISEIIKDYYSQKYNISSKMIHVFDYEGYFDCVINLDSKDYATESLDAREILTLLTTEFALSFNLAISNPIEDFSSFYDNYQTVLGYFKYSFIYGNNNVFTEKMISDYEHTPINFNVDIIRNFEPLLKSNKLDLLKEEITLLFNQIKMKGYSYLYTYNLSVQIIGLISRECVNQNITSESLNQHVLLETFSKISNLEQCIDWFLEVIDEFGTHIQIRNTNIDQTFIQDIIIYIKNNINDQLSLNSVAEHFGLSTGHLSRLFKEKAGIHFSDFVVQTKFEKATQLLLSDPSKKISDIAEELGYSNLTYFTKLFKEKYGMTPTQYRKSH